VREAHRCRPPSSPLPAVAAKRLRRFATQNDLIWTAADSTELDLAAAPNGGYFASSSWAFVTESDVVLNRRAIASGMGCGARLTRAHWRGDVEIRPVLGGLPRPDPGSARPRRRGIAGRGCYPGPARPRRPAVLVRAGRGPRQRADTQLDGARHLTGQGRGRRRDLRALAPGHLPAYGQHRRGHRHHHDRRPGQPGREPGPAPAAAPHACYPCRGTPASTGRPHGAGPGPGHGGPGGT
jgi:hypothetical protein